MGLKKLLATVGLAASLAGCGGASDVVRYQHGGLTYTVQHATGWSIPDYDWQRAASRRAVNFAQDGRLPEGFMTTPYLHADGSTYQEGDEEPRYDAVLWVADTNGDHRSDLLRLLVNTQVTTAPNIRSVGRSIHQQAIVQDVNRDGMADRAWVDDRDAQGDLGLDGVYDEFELTRPIPMQELADNLIWYPRRTPEQR